MPDIARIHTLWPSQTVHIPAFFGALLLAPLAVTALSFFLVVPVFALAMGGPIYLLVGGPILFWWLSQHPCDSGKIAFLALVTNAIICAAAMLLAAATGEHRLFDGIMFYLAFGSVFAPAWGAMFGWLYVRFTRNA